MSSCMWSFHIKKIKYFSHISIERIYRPRYQDIYCVRTRYNTHVQWRKQKDKKKVTKPNVCEYRWMILLRLQKKVPLSKFSFLNLVYFKEEEEDFYVFLRIDKRARARVCVVNLHKWNIQTKVTGIIKFIVESNKIVILW